MSTPLLRRAAALASRAAAFLMLKIKLARSRVALFLTAKSTFSFAAGVLQSVCAATFVASAGLLLISASRGLSLFAVAVLLFLAGAYAKGKGET